MGELGKGNPKRNEAIIVNDDADAPSFMNPISGDIFVSNKVGKRIMELADGSMSVDEIANKIFTEFPGAVMETVQQEAAEFLQLATKNGLVEWE